MTPVLSNFIHSNSQLTLVASAVCGALAVEESARAVKSLGGIFFSLISGEEENQKSSVLDREIARSRSNLEYRCCAALHQFGAAAFFAMAGANLIPGSAKLLGLSLLALSATAQEEHRPPGRYLTLKAVKWISIFSRGLARFAFRETNEFRAPGLIRAACLGLAVAIYRYDVIAKATLK